MHELTEEVQCADARSRADSSRLKHSPPYASSSHSADGDYSVMVWDPDRERMQALCKCIAQDGRRAFCFSDIDDLQVGTAASACCVVLIAVGQGPREQSRALEIMRDAKRAGFYIVAYEQGFDSMSFSIRSKILLAGASEMLDYRKSDFDRRLCSALSALFREQARESDGLVRLQTVMQSLGLVGESAASIALFQKVMRISPLSDLPVLITGESGTGKELLARAIHHLDPLRTRGPFVPINCGAINPGVVESELFGHRRGAFTHADQDRTGLIRSAQGGVLFLDEVGELPAVLQVKLLRVLQEKRVHPVGDDHETSVNVRVIAATNQHLDHLVAEKNFRTDLYHRLNVLRLHVAPLRERPDDLVPLIQHILTRSHQMGLCGVTAVDDEAIAGLRQLEFPGNVRELENILRQALVNKQDDGPLRLKNFPATVWEQLSHPSGMQGDRAEEDCARSSTTGCQSRPTADLAASILSVIEANGWNLMRFRASCERLLLDEALTRTRGNQSQAAKLLGITSRWLYNRLHKYRPD